NSRKAGPPEAALRFRISHECAPHEPGAQILSHEHGNSGINRNHIRVVPLLQRIKRIYEPVAAPGQGSVAVLNILENTQCSLRQERQRASRGAGNHGPINGSDLRRTAPDHVSILRVRCGYTPEVVAIVGELFGKLEAEPAMDL